MDSEQRRGSGWNSRLGLLLGDPIAPQNPRPHFLALSLCLPLCSSPGQGSQLPPAEVNLVQIFCVSGCTRLAGPDAHLGPIGYATSHLPGVISGTQRSDCCSTGKFQGQGSILPQTEVFSSFQETRQLKREASDWLFITESYLHK